MGKGAAGLRSLADFLRDALVELTLKAKIDATVAKTDPAGFALLQDSYRPTSGVHLIMAPRCRCYAGNGISRFRAVMENDT